MTTQFLQRYIEVASCSTRTIRNKCKRNRRVRFINRAYNTILNRNNFQD